MIKQHWPNTYHSGFPKVSMEFLPENTRLGSKLLPLIKGIEKIVFSLAIVKQRFLKTIFLFEQKCYFCVRVQKLRIVWKAISFRNNVFPGVNHWLFPRKQGHCKKAFGCLKIKYIWK